MSVLPRTARLVHRSLANLLTRRPLCVSFEITHHCNARCRHCHRGEKVREARATAERFGEVYRELRPPVVQISGGEPTTRGDVEDIIRAIRQPGGIPFVILVTNGSLLSRSRILRFREIGVDQFSISLDFPDERHDEFRRIPGLFARIRDLIGGLAPDERRMIVLNAVITAGNVRDLLPLAALAYDWGVGINFSPYTWLRTGDRDFIPAGDDLKELEVVVDGLMAFKSRHDTVRTSEPILRDMVRFFDNETRPGCRAGERFLVVNPDATLSPCGLIMGSYGTREELLEGFTRSNRCAACNTCIRALTERPFDSLVAGGIRRVRA